MYKYTLCGLLLLLAPFFSQSVALSQQTGLQPSTANGTKTVSRDAVLQELNRARARRGLYPFKYDAKLTHWAAKEAGEQARRGRMGHHIGISRSGARVGGVGYHSGQDHTGRNFITCACFDRKHKYAGAALVVTRNKTYYAFYSK